MCMHDVIVSLYSHSSHMITILPLLWPEAQDFPHAATHMLVALILAVLPVWAQRSFAMLWYEPPMC